MIKLIILLVSCLSGVSGATEMELSSYGMEYTECVKFVKNMDLVLRDRFNISRDRIEDDTYTIGVIMDRIEGEDYVENFVLTCSKIDGTISFGRSRMEQ